MSRSVVVTGASGGIGQATALELAGAGYDVIGTVRTAEKAASLDTAARERGLTVRTVRCDVADAASTERAFTEIAELTGGGPWAVVNNAGYGQAGAVEDVTDDEARAQLEVNLLAPARIARLVLPGMRERGEGRIVNVSSILGRVTVPLVGWYCASKHGLEALSDALRMEVADAGIHVVLIEPGTFGTGIWGEARYPAAPVSDRYAGTYVRARGMTEPLVRFMPDPVWVARTVRLALGAPVPLARYLVGADAVAGVIANKVVPTPVTDLIKGMVAGVQGLPLIRRRGR